MSYDMWRPFHHDVDLDLHEEQTIHWMLVNIENERTTMILCGGGLGQVITGKKGQVNCPHCLANSYLKVDYFA